MKRLLVVADHSLVIHSIRLALRQTAGFQVAGFVDGRGPIAGLLERHQPEVVLARRHAAALETRWTACARSPTVLPDAADRPAHHARWTTSGSPRPSRPAPAR